MDCSLRYSCSAAIRTIFLPIRFSGGERYVNPGASAFDGVCASAGWKGTPAIKVQAVRRSKFFLEYIQLPINYLRKANSQENWPAFLHHQFALRSRCLRIPHVALVIHV